MRTCRIVLSDPFTASDHFLSLVAGKFDSRVIEFGPMLRKVMGSGNDLGVRIKNHVDKGEIVPIKLLGELLMQELILDNRSIVIKSFPRNEEQINLLKDSLKTLSVPLIKLWHLHLTSVDHIVKNELKHLGGVATDKYEITEESIRTKLQRDMERNQSVIGLMKNEVEVITVDIDYRREGSILNYLESVLSM